MTGGFLLLGGRAADLLSRLRTFLSAVGVFALVSVAGAIAPSGGPLIVARLVKGVAARLLAPAALSLITSNWPEGPEGGRALGWYATAGACGFVGRLVLGGVLTEVSWWLVFALPVPIAVAALIAGSRLLPPDPPPTGRIRPGHRRHRRRHARGAGRHHAHPRRPSAHHPPCHRRFARGLDAPWSPTSRRRRLPTARCGQPSMPSAARTSWATTPGAPSTSRSRRRRRRTGTPCWRSTPGGVASFADAQPLGRVARPEEIAEVLCFSSRRAPASSRAPWSWRTAASPRSERRTRTVGADAAAAASAPTRH